MFLMTSGQIMNRAEQSTPGCVEVVRIRPHAGKADALRALRPRFSAEFRTRTPGFQSHQFYELEDGSFLDIVLWDSSASLEAVDENHPLLDEWYGMVDIISMETGEPVAP